jgi:uncharacterized membrane protein YGL010W
MKTIQQWLDEYSVSHQNPTNKMIHWICVPLIFFSVIGLLYSIQFPVKLFAGMNLNVALIALALVTVYYFVLSKSLSVGMLLFSLVCIGLCFEIQQVTTFPLWAICIGIFVIAWIGQFYGHNVEGKKPSFLKDLQYLMIGPAWLMSFVYKKLGIAL